MRIAIMQPYLFPYLGYFQLLASVDRFVLYDDVQYMKNGWINRNRILSAGRPAYVTVPVRVPSSRSRIREVEVTGDRRRWVRKIVETLRQSYARSPQLDAVIDLVRGVLDSEVTSISELAKRSVQHVATALSLRTEFVWTSSTYDNDHLRGEERVVDICRREGASVYVNAPGGEALYSASRFDRAGIALEILAPELPEYAQEGAELFVPGLSVLDCLLNCPTDEVRRMIGRSSTRRKV